MEAHGRRRVSASPVKAPVEVNFKANGVEGVQRGLKLVGKEAHTTQGNVKTGAQGMAGALAQMSGEMRRTNEGMKQLITSGAEMALVMGVGGPLVGALGLLGLTAYNIFSGIRKEMEETRKKMQDEVTAMVNAGNSAGLMKRAQDIMQGQPGDLGPDGKPAPFSGGLAGKRAAIAAAQAKVDRMSFGGPGYSWGKFRQAMKDLEALKAGAAEMEREYALVEAAIRNPSNGLLTRSGPLAIGVTAQAPDPVYEREMREWLAGRARQLREVGALGKPGVQLAGSPMSLGKDVIQEQLAGSQSALKDNFENLENIARDGRERLMAQMRPIGELMGDVIAAGIEKGFGGAVGAMLSGLGGMIKQFGINAFAGLTFMKTILDAIKFGAPEVGLVAAVGMIALGSLMQSAGGRMGGGGSGYGGGSSGGGGVSSGTHAQIIDRGVIGMDRLTPRTPVTANFTVIGPNDPNAIRGIDEILRRINQRGSLA